MLRHDFIRILPNSRGDILISWPEPIYAVSPGGWEEIETAANSRATETVVGEDMLQSLPMSGGRCHGLTYQTADDTDIVHLGEVRFVAEADTWIQR